MNNTEKAITLFISDSIGSVSGLIVEPEYADALLVLAHGAGAGMSHPFMAALSRELAERRVATLRYNFPYMEQRRNRPDPPAIAGKTVAEVIMKAHELYPRLPLFSGGKSFGGRMTSQRIAKDCPSFVKGIIFYGFPLHPLGAPSTERADHLKGIVIPMLFLQGARDKMAELPLLEKTTAGLPTSTLTILEGADHSFKAGKQDLIPVLAEHTRQWINGNSG